jgi:type IX secretion system PorP/SprF family membrane protein
MKREHFLIWLILIFCHQVAAQDQTNFTQFYLNPYLLNPSYTGIDGRAALLITYRKQWATIQDGPEIANVTFHAPISKRVGLGLSATNDKKGLLDNSGLMLTFGYNIPIAPQSFFRFGISGGISSNTVDLDKLAPLNDPAIGNLLDNSMSVLGNAGISFHLNTFHAGISLPVIFEPTYIGKDDFTITEIKPFESLIFHFSNRFYFNNNKNIFEPYAIYRMATNLPHQFEVAGIVHLNHILWVGSSFKQDFGISALGGIKLKNTLAIGASYGLKNSGENELNSPTYEVTLGLLLGKHRKETPRYSFVDTEKEKIKKGTGKSASEMIAEKRRQDELAKKKQQEELAKKKQEEQKQAEELAKKQQEEARQAEALAAAQKQQEEETARKQQEEVAQRQQQEQARQQAEALARQEEARKQAETVALQQEETRRQQQVVVQQQNTPPVETTPVYRTSTREDSITITHKPRFGHIDSSMEILKIEVTEHNEEDELERIARLRLHAEDPDEHHDSPEAHPNAERHEFVRKGAHRQEMDASDYVVAGVFRQESNAKHFSDGLKKMGFKVNYGHLTEKAVWYVYLIRTSDINKARAERDRYRKMKIFRDAWLLTVHH